MASDYIPYNTHRKHRYYSQDHPQTASQKRLVQRLRRIRTANQSDAAFGKINWAAYDHQQLYDMIQTSDPAAMGTAAHQWAELAQKTDSTTSEVHKTVQKLLLSWRGGSAVRAADSASKLTSWASQASSTMHQVGVGLDSYTGAVVDARNHMPEPVYATADRYFREGYDVKADSGPSAAVLAEQLLDDHMPSQRQAQQAKAEAVRVMDRYEKASKGVRDRLPSFVDTPGADGGSGDPNFESPGTSGKGHDSTTAASAISSPGANPDLAGAGSGFPGGVAGSGSGAYAGPAGRTLGVGGMSATEMGGAAASAGAAGATGAAGARGTGLTSGFLPPGAGARHDDDHEHNNRYVKESGFDFLDDVPPAYPPVLGE